MIVFSPPGPHHRIACIENTDHAQELFLNCSLGGIVNIRNIQYGAQDVPQDDAVECHWENQDDECSVYSTQLTPEMGACMGQSNCNVNFRAPAVDDCDQITNYFQLEYQCLPGRGLGAR